MVLRILEAFEKAGLKYVYLRNYENLPWSVGNDVDLLVDPGARPLALSIIRATARDGQWKFLGYVEFSPFALFLGSPDGSDVLHLDLFDRIEWHWCEFAETALILDRRVRTGRVFRPHVLDEIYMNVCDRWIYLGEIREKHRAQLARAQADEGDEGLKEAFSAHLGRGPGSRIYGTVSQGRWEDVGAMKWTLRRACLGKYGILRPASLWTGILRYVRRSAGRLLAPPGPFVIVLGADGVGKSSVIEGIRPLLEDMTGVSNPLQFHWKPCAASIRTPNAPPPAPQNPRGKQIRGRFLSVLFLCYHWIGFWIGWFRWLYPGLVGSRAVVGDRYAFDLYLDPTRFRLKISEALSRLAFRTVPQPDVILGLVADPLQVVARKAELSVSEVETYQARLTGLRAVSESITIIDANGSLPEVQEEARKAILEWAARKASRA